MYQFINENIIKVLKIIDRKRNIDPYLLMMQIFNEGSVSNNQRYKTIYRKYWQLNAARLSDHYCNHYFQVMEDYRYKEHRNIEDVVKALYDVPSNAKGKRTIQFSFATKLLHTLDNKRPVYDSLIGDFYFFPQIKPTWEYKKKLTAYLQAYDFLQQEHKRVLDNHLLSESIGKFREHFGLPQAYTDHKIVDTLLWKFAAYVRMGAIMRGDIEYS